MFDNLASAAYPLGGFSRMNMLFADLDDSGLPSYFSHPLKWIL